MATTHVLAPNPIWYFADLTGRPLGSGYMYTYSSLNPTVEKAVYMDQVGLNAWTNPIRFRLNGSQGPFYWTVDTDSPDDLYYIEVYDVDGNLVYTIDDFTPPGGGGGGIITEARDLENLIINGQFYRNVGSTLISPVPALSTVAPSAHAGFVGSIIYPDITFEKDAASTATDTLTFPEFLPLGIEALQNDVTGQFYAHYVCTNFPNNETKKDFNFPITTKVQNLSGTPCTFTVWARSNGLGANTISLYSYQFFGDGGGATAPATSLIDSRALTSDWVKYVFQFTMNSVTGDSLGACGNDALFIKLRLPIGLACDIDITKPCLYVGSLAPDEDYHTHDQIDSVISSPRVGDVRVSLNAFQPFGWVLCNDGVLSSGAVGIVLPAGIPSARANIDTFPLFKLVWEQTSANPTYAPIYDSLGVATVRGASPEADFAANKQLKLTQTLGRALASAGLANGQINTWNVGHPSVGNETHTLTVAEMPSHTHSIAPYTNTTAASGGGVRAFLSVGSITTTPEGGSAPHSIMQPTSFWNVFLKL